jgi:GTP pyrophosphokinase
MVSPVSLLPRDGAVSDSQIDTWLRALSEHREAAELEKLRAAITVARELHRGEVMADGTDRLLALLQTADLLDQLMLDDETLIAAVLSEFPADGGQPERIEAQFGQRVLGMLSLITRIRELSIIGANEQTADNVEALRRLLLGLADDVRVLLVVLAKRLRLMRGLSGVPEDAQRAIARETQVVHAPLANRLGVWQLKWELEDLSLRYLQPATYKDLAKRLDGKRREREDFIAEVLRRLLAECAGADIQPEISGRPKHIYSIWKKMQRKGVGFEQVFDVRAVRILVDTVPECYEVLGIIHGLWRPVPGEFDDYIARPKGNGYRSLHTAVIGDDGKPLEVQVRTHKMHEQAERGVAAHWRYKENRATDETLERRIQWMRRWLENPYGALGDQDDDEVRSRLTYVLTPQYRVVELPEGATAVDFAYAVHTSIGHRCRGAKADGKIISLTRPLQSGQTIEILTAKQGGPSRDWLSAHAGYVVTARARNRIRHWFKKLDYDAHVQAGRTALEKELNRLGVPRPDLERLLTRFNLQSVDDLLAAIGRGDLSPIQVANTQSEQAPRDHDRLIAERPVRKIKGTGQNRGAQIEVRGVSDLLTQMAKCCKPVPNDTIIGFITRGRGVTVHRRDCQVVRKMSPEQHARLVEVRWAEEQRNSAFLVDVQIFAGDRKGLLRDISSVFANEEIDVLEVKTQSDRRREKASMRFTVEVQDMNQLSRVIEKLAQIPDILDVRRQT